MKRETMGSLCAVMALAILCGCGAGTQDQSPSAVKEESSAISEATEALSADTTESYADAPAESAGTETVDADEGTSTDTAEDDSAASAATYDVNTASDTVDAENTDSGVPQLILDRKSVYEYYGTVISGIRRGYSYFELDSAYKDKYRKLSSGLDDAMYEVIYAKGYPDDTDIGTDYGEDIELEESWHTYLRRADRTVISIINEYSAEGLFDGEYYNSYLGHSYRPDSGEEITFDDVVWDRGRFFDIAAPRLAQHIDKKMLDQYGIEQETDVVKLRSDIMEYLRDGRCAWTIDPQGVTLWFDSGMLLRSAVCVTVLFSEDETGEIFMEEFVPEEGADWIMQTADCVETYCDIDDSGEGVYVRAHSVRDGAGQNEIGTYYTIGLAVTCGDRTELFNNDVPGGSAFYDVFLIHRDHRTILLESHDEYDTYFVNTYTLGDRIKKADSIRAGFERTEGEAGRLTNDYRPYYIPTDISKIRIVLNPGSGKARAENISVDGSGIIKGETVDVHAEAEGVSAADKEEPFYGLWAGAFIDRQNALTLVEELQKKGYRAFCVYSRDWENLNQNPYWVVSLGRFSSEAEAKSYIEYANNAGYEDVYVRYTGERVSR